MRLRNEGGMGSFDSVPLLPSPDGEEEEEAAGGGDVVV